ncbi:hypothetical protein [Actinocrinis sp.]|uniref:hypothetical protein n=1 Tax=Actinocrinis sp. TaxID=1920516 RepID=UPI002D699971|nr:hypothetical protein [Actinocrinis sp.]HZP52213.1 hypothetical protein [Actinocrinis sp.]
MITVILATTGRIRRPGVPCARFRIRGRIVLPSRLQPVNIRDKSARHEIAESLGSGVDGNANASDDEIIDAIEQWQGRGGE